MAQVASERSAAKSFSLDSLLPTSQRKSTEAMEEETQAAACKAEWDQTVDFFCTQIDTEHSKSAAYMAEVMKQGYVADDDEWYARAKADTSIGMFVLAWSALAPPHSHLYSALMPIAILFVQFSFTASLFVVEMQSINGMQSWCPNSASMNEKLIMGSIAIAYAIKLHMQREACTPAQVERPCAAAVSHAHCLAILQTCTSRSRGATTRVRRSPQKPTWRAIW